MHNENPAGKKTEQGLKNGQIGTNVTNSVLHPLIPLFSDLHRRSTYGRTALLLSIGAFFG